MEQRNHSIGTTSAGTAERMQWLISQWSFLDCSASAFFWRTQSRLIALNEKTRDARPFPDLDHAPDLKEWVVSSN
jgi:hypothetical protein